MGYAIKMQRNRAIALVPSLKNRARAGQSMTSLLVGIAIMGCVGAATAKLTQSTHTQEQALSAKNGAAEIMDTIAGEIRTQTRYSDLASKYGGTGEGGTGWKTIDGDGTDEFIVRTTARKICNDTPSTNCDAAHVDIEIVDKGTGETVLKQTVSRTYTHYEESIAFSSLGSLPVPEDAIAVRYTSDGGSGNSGGSRTTYGYDLKINSTSCAWDYKPNNASPRPNGCVACAAPANWKQYRSGDCTLGTCPTGQKANAARTGCEAITCPSGQHLEGDNCVTNEPCDNNAFEAAYNKMGGYWLSLIKTERCCDRANSSVTTHYPCCWSEWRNSQCVRACDGCH